VSCNRGNESSICIGRVRFQFQTLPLNGMCLRGQRDRAYHVCRWRVSNPREREIPFCENGRGTRNQIVVIQIVVKSDVKNGSGVWVWQPNGGYVKTVSGGGYLQRETPPNK
jgi:hypothetical protein